MTQITVLLQHPDSTLLALRDFPPNHVLEQVGILATTADSTIVNNREGMGSIQVMDYYWQSLGRVTTKTSESGTWRTICSNGQIRHLPSQANAAMGI